MAPDVSPELIRVLVDGDDTQLREHIREIGHHWTGSGFSWSLRAFWVEDSAEHEARRRFLVPYLRRLGTAVEAEFGETWISWVAEYYEREGPDISFARSRLAHDRIRTFEDDVLTREQKYDRLRALEESSAQLRDTLQLALLDRHLYYLALEIGRPDEIWPLARRSLAFARAVDHATLECQVLGFLAFMHGRDGEPDSTQVYYDLAMQRAMEVRSASQVPRIAFFYRDFYDSRGRASLANELEELGLNYCREFGGGGYELRFLIGAMNRDAERGCWDRVARNLSRADALAQGLVARTVFERAFQLDVDLLRARLLFARGKPAAADQQMRALRESIEAHPSAHRAELFLSHWCDDLIANGWFGSALAIAEDGLERVIATSNRRLIPRFWLRRAQVLYNLGRIDEAAASVDSFELALQAVESEEDTRRDVRLARVSGDVLRSRIALGSHPSEAAARADSAYEEILALVRETDACADGYVDVARGAELMDLLHEQVETDPAAGYEIEMAWRGVPRELGRRRGTKGDHAFDSGADSLGSGEIQTRDRNEVKTRDRENGVEESNSRSIVPLELTGEAARLVPILAAGMGTNGATHLLFRVTSDGVIRWTHDPSGIRLERLSIPVDTLLVAAERLAARISIEPADPLSISPELHHALESMAEYLLPTSWAGEGAPPERILVTTDRFLRHIPFAALDIARGDDYVPLLTRSDLAYLRSIAPQRVEAVSEETRPGLAIAHPELPPSLERTYPALRSIPKSEIEIAHLEQVLGNVEVLHGVSATKEQLMARWGDAPFLYFATHAVRDPRDPYVTFLPLSMGVGEESRFASDLSQLETIDIRRADLSGCSLVVLSACGSGAPASLRDANNAPSLAEAFIDAGAAAIVETMWSVRDDEAEQLMRGFIDGWGGGGLDPVRALCEAQRSQMVERGSVRHPFYWSAYGVLLGSLDVLEPRAVAAASAPPRTATDPLDW